MTFNSIKNRNLFTDTLLYTVSVVVARGLGILIFPILVSNMNETDLVHYDWVLTNVMLSMTFAVFGVDSASGRMLADKSYERERIIQLSFYTIAPQTILSLTILLTYLIYSNVKITSLDAIIITVLLLASIFINQITNNAKWLLDRNRVIKIQVLLGVSQAFFLLLTYAFGVLNFTTGLAAQMAGAVFVSLYGICTSKTRFTNFSFPSGLFAFVSKSVTLGLTTFLAGIYLVLEKNIIYQIATIVEASLYLVHLKVVLLFSFGLSALQISVVPHLIKILHDKNFRRFYLYNSLILVLIVVSTLIFLTISSSIFDFFTNKHTLNKSILLILLLIQAIIILNTLGETLFIFLESYKTLLTVNAIHISLFLMFSLFFFNENLLMIICGALVCLTIKLMLLILFNIRFIGIIRK